MKSLFEKVDFYSFNIEYIRNYHVNKYTSAFMLEKTIFIPLKINCENLYYLTKDYYALFIN